MKDITKIIENNEVIKYLEKRQLISQYLKSCKYITAGFFGKVGFKLRQPKKDAIWSFRINKQYRAYGYFHGDIFVVYHIDNHQ